ncbi:MAG: hypothetical protein GF401_02950 [Chitinivibrionales bacterium]|nr:hypothetical protein [Chitinivibrionales bacterium]
MQTPLNIGNLTIDPPLFCAPMAGITHSAFRRLMADFKGYGALFTEMLSVRSLVHEKISVSPFTRRRENEGTVFYQLVCNGEEDFDAALGNLAAGSPDAVDLNCGCSAPEITRWGGGAALFADRKRLEKTLRKLRTLWKGPLSVKCRLGGNSPQWEKEFFARIKIIENCGVDALFLHPRFTNEKLKRRARWEFFSKAASSIAIPVIANGDIMSPRIALERSDLFSDVKGIMIGRMAVVRPWIFAQKNLSPLSIDFHGVWTRFFDYVLEDFPPEKAGGKIKEFSTYFARNFMFGHELFRKIQPAKSLEEMRSNASAFLKRGPETCLSPTVMGI